MTTACPAHVLVGNTFIEQLRELIGQQYQDQLRVIVSDIHQFVRISNKNCQCVTVILESEFGAPQQTWPARFEAPTSPLCAAELYDVGCKLTLTNTAQTHQEIINYADPAFDPDTLITRMVAWCLDGN